MASWKNPGGHVQADKKRSPENAFQLSIESGGLDFISGIVRQSSS